MTKSHLKRRNLVLIVDGPVVPTELRDFCGRIIKSEDSNMSLCHKTVYLSGDVKTISDKWPLSQADRVFAIKEHSSNLNTVSLNVVSTGQVPILISGVGAYYRSFFNEEDDFFKQVVDAHEFQDLTESNKPGKAHRSGIYLTPVKEGKSGYEFNLLRCSSNLSGPTLNFKEPDETIVNRLNKEARYLFNEPAELNHVLAQVYKNSRSEETGRAQKAKIKSHSDKTKDMPENGIMAFCSFYDSEELHDRLVKSETDPYDWVAKMTGQSGLTRLCFKVKPEAKLLDESLKNGFTVTLYPNSVFFISLTTNRYYTHEIKPSVLDISSIPTRMGYVVRCSSTKALYTNDMTHILMHGKLHPLTDGTEEDYEELRKIYRRENLTIEEVDYGVTFFSMNKGDYMKPII